MNESQLTVVGHVATEVEYRESASGVPAARFRVASTARRFDQQRGMWTDAHTNFFTVWAWRSLAANVASSVSLGEPVIVTGRLRVKESRQEGQATAVSRYVDLIASSVGHDLSRGTAAFVRVASGGRGGGVPPVPAADTGESADPVWGQPAPGQHGGTPPELAPQHGAP